MREKVTGTRLGEMATGTWDKLEKVFEEWKKTHPLAGVKPNVGGLD